MSVRTLCSGKAKGAPRSAPGGPFTAKWIVRATVVLSYRSSCKAYRSFVAPHDAPCGRCAAPRDASFDRCDAPHAAPRDLCAVGGAVPYRTFPERTESMVPEPMVLEQSAASEPQLLATARPRREKAPRREITFSLMSKSPGILPPTGQSRASSYIQQDSLLTVALLRQPG